MRLSGADPISQVNYNGCLPVTCASRSVHGLEKTAAEAGLKLVSNGGFEEMEHEFPFERFCPEKNRTTFSDFQLLPEIFCWNDPRRFVPFTF